MTPSERSQFIFFGSSLNGPSLLRFKSRWGLCLMANAPESGSQTGSQKTQAPNRLTAATCPKQGISNPEPTRKFRGVQRRYPGDSENRALGLLGEQLVLYTEREALQKAGRSDLALRVKHTAIEEGDGAGYDVLSFFEDGRPKFIEVKTTAGPKATDFFLSPNEVAFARLHGVNFELRRIFDYDRATNSGKCFSLSGQQVAELELLPTQFRVCRLVED